MKWQVLIVDSWFMISEIWEMILSWPEVVMVDFWTVDGTLFLFFNSVSSSELLLLALTITVDLPHTELIYQRTHISTDYCGWYRTWCFAARYRCLMLVDCCWGTQWRIRTTPRYLLIGLHENWLTTKISLPNGYQSLEPSIRVWNYVELYVYNMDGLNAGQCWLASLAMLINIG